MDDVSGPASMDDDPRVALVFDEARRGLTQQHDAIESLRNRAGTLIFAASFASSLLGSKALADGIDAWDWVALGLLFAIGALDALMLWPYYDLSFRLDPEELLTDYIDADPQQSLTAMRRDLALRLEADRRRNGRIVKRMREALQVALVLLLVEIAAWLFSIADTSP